MPDRSPTPALARGDVPPPNLAVALEHQFERPHRAGLNAINEKMRLQRHSMHQALLPKYLVTACANFLPVGGAIPTDRELAQPRLTHGARGDWQHGFGHAVTVRASDASAPCTVALPRPARICCERLRIRAQALPLSQDGRGRRLATAGSHEPMLPSRPRSERERDGDGHAAALRRLRSAHPGRRTGRSRHSLKSRDRAPPASLSFCHLAGH
jgi:hypothetical protein